MFRLGDHSNQGYINNHIDMGSCLLFKESHVDSQQDRTNKQWPPVGWSATSQLLEDIATWIETYSMLFRGCCFSWEEFDVFITCFLFVQNFLHLLNTFVVNELADMIGRCDLFVWYQPDGLVFFPIYQVPVVNCKFKSNYNILASWPYVCISTVLALFTAEQLLKDPNYQAVLRKLYHDKTPALHGPTIINPGTNKVSFILNVWQILLNHDTNHARASVPSHERMGEGQLAGLFSQPRPPALCALLTAHRPDTPRWPSYNASLWNVHLLPGAGKTHFGPFCNHTSTQCTEMWLHSDHINSMQHEDNAL